MLRRLANGLNDINETHPLITKFLKFISSERSSIPAKFLLPLEQKLIKFNDARQRLTNHARDKQFLVGSFLLIKVMVGKMFFKPYKVTRFFGKEL